MSCLNGQCEIRRLKGMLEIRESETQFIPVILTSEIGNLFARVRRFEIEVARLFSSWRWRWLANESGSHVCSMIHCPVDGCDELLRDVIIAGITVV